MALPMQDQRALDALARIDRALQRIEAAAANGQSAHSLSADRQAEELERLRSAHHLLRSRVETAIGEIDRMLEPVGAG
jgi:uncharacterized membrane protein